MLWTEVQVILKNLQMKKPDILRYSNCWEDADLLLEALAIQPDDEVLSIGSAGDNSFSLLSKSPKSVVAIDPNPIQLHLIRLKIAALQTFDYQNFLMFLGFRASDNRLELFEQIRMNLPKESAQFWNENQKQIAAGIIYAGKFDRYLRFFAKQIVPLIHTKKRIHQLFAPKSQEEQQKFYKEVWENKRWKWLFKIFFSQTVMGKMGRDPAFFNEVKVPVATYIFNKTKAHLSDVACQQNYFLYYILNGHFGEKLPHYARKENFEAIKANLHKLELVQARAENYTGRKSFTKFNLSNIFEYMDDQAFEMASKHIVSLGQKQSRFAYWNLMVPRNMGSIREELETIDFGAKKDKGFFYGDFVVNGYLFCRCARPYAPTKQNNT